MTVHKVESFSSQKNSFYKRSYDQNVIVYCDNHSASFYY